MAFEKTLRTIGMAIAKDVQHVRKKVRMASIPDASILCHAHEEIVELSDSLATDDGPDMLELCDSLAPLFHFMLKHGWESSLVDESIVDKLLLRFDFDDEDRRIIAGFKGKGGTRRKIIKTGARRSSAKAKIKR